MHNGCASYAAFGGTENVWLGRLPLHLGLANRLMSDVYHVYHVYRSIASGILERVMIKLHVWLRALLEHEEIL